MKRIRIKKPSERTLIGIAFIAFIVACIAALFGINAQIDTVDQISFKGRTECIEGKMWVVEDNPPKGVKPVKLPLSDANGNRVTCTE